MTEVILVDNNNRIVGKMEKMKAHQKGLLHRAFSIFVFNSNGELLIHKRNSDKYHSGGLWSNTVCSHPEPGEAYSQAVHRRLKEELGFDCKLKKQSCFTYKTEFDNGLTENEFDCIYTGRSDKIPKPDPCEVEDYKWMKLSDLKKDINANPENYTFWFKKIISDEILGENL